MLSCKVWTYDYTRQQLSDELDFRVEAVHAKRAQEELDAPAFAFLCPDSDAQTFTDGSAFIENRSL